MGRVQTAGETPSHPLSASTQYKQVKLSDVPKTDLTNTDVQSTKVTLNLNPLLFIWTLSLSLSRPFSYLLNNKNGSDEKGSQCACFWLKIIKGILFGVQDLWLKNSFVSGNIYRWRVTSLKKQPDIILLCVQLLRINTWSNGILPLNEKMISVDSFSLVLSKKNVDRRVTLATCGISYDICL